MVHLFQGMIDVLLTIGGSDEKSRGWRIKLQGRKCLYDQE